MDLDKPWVVTEVEEEEAIEVITEAEVTVVEWEDTTLTQSTKITNIMIIEEIEECIEVKEQEVDLEGIEVVIEEWKDTTNKDLEVTVVVDKEQEGEAQEDSMIVNIISEEREANDTKMTAVTAVETIEEEDTRMNPGVIKSILSTVGATQATKKPLKIQATDRLTLWKV